MAGEVSAAQIGEHITMPVAILSDRDDAGLVCDHVAAKIMCRCLGCCFRTGREQPVSGGSAAWEPKVRRLSPVEGWREMDSNHRFRAATSFVSRPRRTSRSR